MAAFRSQPRIAACCNNSPPSPEADLAVAGPYFAIGVFALAMLVLTALLQWRELDTARSALEGDMHWAERTIESRLHAHQDFLAELGREQEFRQLTCKPSRSALRYASENPEIQAIIWVDTDGRWNGWRRTGRPPPSSASNWPASRWSPCGMRCAVPVFSPDYRGADQRRTHDTVVPVQRGAAISAQRRRRPVAGALLRGCCPPAAARYSLSVVDKDSRPVLNPVPRSSRPTGAFRHHQPRPAEQPRLGLNIVAYRGSGARGCPTCRRH